MLYIIYIISEVYTQRCGPRLAPTRRHDTHASLACVDLGALARVGVGLPRRRAHPAAPTRRRESVSPWRPSERHPAANLSAATCSNKILQGLSFPRKGPMSGGNQSLKVKR